MKLYDTKYNTEIKQCLLYLKYIFNEKMGIFFITEQDIAYPYIILIDNIYKLYIEKILILTTDNFETIFICLYSCYFIYNISYPKGLQLSLSFIHKIIFDLQDNVSINKKFDTLFNKICK